MLRRRASRVVLVDRRGRVLLFRGGDPARPDDGTWWFTAGGGAEAGETLADAAVREVREETGLDVAGRVEAPVWARDTAFEFEGLAVEQAETFFVVSLDLDGDQVVPDHAGWTDIERRSVDGQRWWTRADLATTTDTVFPEGLAGLLDTWLGPARVPSARVVVVDVHGRVLLSRVTDPARPSLGSWWVTPGGAAEDGESVADAAVRELREETGLDVTGRLHGPVWERDHGFEFDGRRYDRHETYLLARLAVDGDSVVLDASGADDVERASTLEWRWWTRVDLATTTDTVVPEGFAGLLDTWLGPAGR